MTNEEYIQLAGNTDCNYKKVQQRLEDISTDGAQILHAAIGLATEAGEILDVCKKNIFYGKIIDDTNLKEEIGDIFWYISRMCDALGLSFEEVMKANIAKLKARYGEKFSEERAVTRNLEAERAILES
jgi:NTP pyrophosphatase (non-canonical NTP hydrolase)